MARDPVCQAEVEIEVSGFKTRYRDGYYYFCSLKCKEIFEKAPEDYAKIDESEMPA